MASIFHKLNIMRGILHGEKAFAGPILAIMGLSDRCNIRCRGCFAHLALGAPSPRQGKNPDLSEKLLDQMCRELPAAGLAEVFISADGEPLMHPRATDMLAKLKQAGLKVILYTNGTLVDQNIARALVKNGIDEVRVSVWAVTSDEHQLCHPGSDPALLEQRRQGLKHLAAAKAERQTTLPRVIISLILTRPATYNLAQRVAFVQECSCDEVVLGLYRNVGGESEDWVLRSQDATALKPQLRNMASKLTQNGIRLSLSRYLVHCQFDPRAVPSLACYAGWFAVRIDTLGRVFPCGHCDYQFGHMDRQSFGEIWHGSAARRFRHLTGLTATPQKALLNCDCANCCLTYDNLRLHRTIRWLRPWAPLGALGPD